MFISPSKRQSYKRLNIFKTQSVSHSWNSTRTQKDDQTPWLFYAQVTVACRRNFSYQSSRNKPLLSVVLPKRLEDLQNCRRAYKFFQAS